ncbi:acyl-CoA dehydrogenase family protein [Pseudomonas cremoricolorata]|uniref:acyl-CoA dehydrogenase family protein n=1 Tax=Pseudomonas cremoricolorata TaxID=157783 RepID=UPI00067634D4|nr:acyl-CoA dehydrogenase family protein [Pseudomonas cremoricolorata]
MPPTSDASDTRLLHCLEPFFQASLPGPIEPLLTGRLRMLAGEGLDQLPLPGAGQTLARWRSLAYVGGADLALTKLYEGHTDALAILAECAASELAQPPQIWGVWAAEPPAARVRIVARGGRDVTLTGRKAWCSGAALIDCALLTAWDQDLRPHLVAVRLDAPGIEIRSDAWQAVGMAGSASLEIDFTGCSATLVGSPGQYLSRAGFWHGGGGIAACWYGAARSLAEYLREHCRKPHSDAHAHAHLGAVDVALNAAAHSLRACALHIDAQPRATAELPVRQLRAVVEQAAEQVIQHVGRALGATPFCRNHHFARLSADLPVFLRQSHAERDLAVLGQQVADLSTGAWDL